MMSPKGPLAKEQIKPLIVGHSYWIECIKTVPWSHPLQTIWLPVFGSIHADDEDSGAMKEAIDRLHVHVDMRFVTEEEMIMMNFIPSTQGTVACGPKFGFKKMRCPTVKLGSI